MRLVFGEGEFSILVAEFFVVIVFWYSVVVKCFFVVTRGCRSIRSRGSFKRGFSFVIF